MKLYPNCDIFTIEGECESCYRYEICKSAKHMKVDSRCELIPIKDFIDFNYSNIVFDINKVDRNLLLEKLKQDYVNHLYELEDSKYIAIWNCDLQGFKDHDDIYFDTFAETYMMAELVYRDDNWYYRIIDDAIPNE